MKILLLPNDRAGLIALKSRLESELSANSASRSANAAQASQLKTTRDELTAGLAKLTEAAISSEDQAMKLIVAERRIEAIDAKLDDLRKGDEASEPVLGHDDADALKAMLHHWEIRLKQSRRTRAERGQLSTAGYSAASDAVRLGENALRAGGLKAQTVLRWIDNALAGEVHLDKAA